MKQPSLFKPEKKTHNGYPLHFLEFWNRYPRRIGKRKAESAYDTACKSLVKREGLSPAKAREKILMAAVAFAKQVHNTKIEFVPHPATWLNQGRYDDELFCREEKASKPASILPSCPYCGGLGNVIVINEAWQREVFSKQPGKEYRRGEAKNWCRKAKAGPFEHGIPCHCRPTKGGSRHTYDPLRHILVSDVTWSE